MKKAKLTIQQHWEIGGALKAFRINHLNAFQVAIQNATPENSPQSRAVQKVMNAIDELRNVMDEMVYKDYFDELGDSYKGIYYGIGERAK